MISYVKPQKLKQNVSSWGKHTKLPVCLTCVSVHATGSVGKKAEEERLKQAYRGKFLNEVMGHMHQILVFLHVLLEPPIFLFLQ